MVLVIPIFIPHQGCPHDCLFCNQRKISGEEDVTTASVDVVQIIDEWLSRSSSRKTVQVAFFGGSFTCLSKDKQNHYLQQVQPYIQSGKVQTIRLSTRPDCIDKEVCETLVQNNVGVVEIGVQSFNDKVLQSSLRGHNVNQCVSAFRQLKQAGVAVGIQLMVGLPGETSASFIKGVKQLIDLRPNFVRLYPVLVVDDSGLANLFRKKQYQPLSLGKAVIFTARAYELLTAEGIDVVRMGLQPSESLEKSILAGPYHPAFGELVRSRLWLKKLRAQCGRLEQSEKLVVHISHRDVSALVGMKRENIKRLETLGYSGRIQIVAEKNLPKGTVQYVVC